MSDPLPLGEKVLLVGGKQAKHFAVIVRNNNILSIALIATVIGFVVPIFGSQATFQALADTDTDSVAGVQSPFFADQSSLFVQKQADVDASSETKTNKKQDDNENDTLNKPFAQKIYDLVGDAPIKEMVPFISARDQKVAAFLVGIAQKESSLGSASPSKDGKTCYNYWGYKGEGQRGEGMGYACFASAQEAVQTVGDKIESLVDSDHTTPSKMVDTWKCGTSCAGDPGAPGWVSTVALYFNKIVDQNS